MLKVETLVVGPLETNCYIVADDQSGECVVVDPGGNTPTILEACNRLGLRIKMIVNTHGHFDHILANSELADQTGAPIAIHKDDAGMLTNPLASLAFLRGRLKLTRKADVLLSDGDEIRTGSSSLIVLHTPGHSPGGISLWNADATMVFAGDALFYESVGRTDLAGGDPTVLERSIRDRLFVLPDATTVYPGHGPATTIGHEKLHNPFIRG